MFGKYLSDDEFKAHKEKQKKLKKRVFELSQNSIVTKLREDIDLQKSRAEHFEREYFNLKKSCEVETISEQQLKSDLCDLYKMIKAKDEIIEELTKLVEKQADEIVKLTDYIYELEGRTVKQDDAELILQTTKEGGFIVLENDQK